MYYWKRHAIVLDYCIEKMAGHLPHTKLGATQKTIGEPTRLGQAIYTGKDCITTMRQG